MESLTRFALRHPRIVIGLVVAVTASALLGLPRSTTQVGYRVFLGDDHPAIRTLDAHIDRFNGGLPVLAVWGCGEGLPCESIFDDASIWMARDVEEALSDHPLVLRVESPVSAGVVIQTEDGIARRRQFVEHGRIPDDRDLLAQRALDDETWHGWVSSPDGRTGAIVVQLASTDSETAAEIVPALRAALAPHEARGFEFHLAGDPVDFVVAGGEMRAETPRLLPIMATLIAVVVYLLTRSLLHTLLALATAGLAVLWARGAMAWLGWPDVELTQALPPAILVIGLCDAIHLLSSYARRLGTGADDAPELRRRWMVESVREVGGACFMTTLTTAVAFLSFVTSAFDAFLRFGVVAAAGVGFALVLTFSLLPVLVVRIPAERLRGPRTQRAWNEGLRLTVDTVRRQPAAILWITGAVALLTTIGVFQVRFDIDERSLLGDNSRVVRWAEFVEDNLRMPDSLEIALTLPPDQPATSPAVVEKIQEISRYLPTVEGLGRSISYLDYLSPVNKLLHEDDPAWDRPADTREGNAQLLLATEFDFQPLVNDWVTADRTGVRIFVQAENLSTTERRELIGSVGQYLDATLPGDWELTLTGPLVVYLTMVDEIQRTQLRSFAAAALIIALLFYAYLRFTGSSTRSAIRWTAIGLSPSLLPVTATLGAMGLLGIPMDAGTAMVAAIIVGIAVDDTFHIIHAYRIGRRRGADPADAITGAINRVGRALITTSFALAVGFFALTLSSWQSIASFGFLAGVAIVTALIADLLVLPAIVLRLSRVREAPEEPLAPSRVLTGRQRVGASLTLVAVTTCMLGITLGSILDRGDSRRLACWIYPNQIVAFTSAMDHQCPLGAHDKVKFIEVDGARYRPHDRVAMGRILASQEGWVDARIERGGQERTVRLPVVLDTPRHRMARFTIATLLAFSMVGISIFLLWCSSSPAALPYAALYGAITTISIYILCSPENQVPAAPFVLSLAFIPSIMIHLALNFPHQRAVVRRVPGLLQFVYGVGALFACAGLYGFFEHPMLWRRVGGVVLISTVVLWGVLILSSALARRQAATALERARAGSAFWGLLAIPLIVGLLGRSSRFDGAVLAACGSLLIPLPIGYAIARYQLFDVRPHARQLAYSAAFSLVYTGALTLTWFFFAENSFVALESNTATQLGLVFIILVTAEILRGRLWNLLLQRTPTVEAHLRDFEQGAARSLRRLGSEEEAAKVLAEATREGLDSRGVSVFLVGERGPRIAAARGDAPTTLAEIEPFLEAFDLGEEPIDLGLEGGASGTPADHLRALGIALMAPLRWQDNLVAVLAVREAHDRMPFTLSEVDFVKRLCAQTAVAIHNATLSSELLRVERYSTIGRIATGLMHDIGKPMSIVWQRAKKLARDDAQPEDVRSVANSIETLTDDALGSIDRLMEHAREGLAGPSAEVPAADAIERAVGAVSRMHESREICVRLTPNLPRVTSSDDLHLALVNLLDNALLASDPDEVTDILATADEHQLTIQIIDRGCGMPPEVRDQAFDPFFTTRAGEGGSGIGLSASRTTIERLGGTVRLESEAGIGTTVSIQLALDES